MMHLSCLPVSLYDDIFIGKSTVIDWIRFGAELGLDAVDVSVKFFPARDMETLKQTLAALEKSGICVCMLACYSDFTHPDPVWRAQVLTDLKADIRLAGALGAKFVRVTAGQNYPGIERTVAVRWVTEGFSSAIEEAERHNIRLAYENHTKGAPWVYWDFSQPAEIFLEILDALSDAPLGVCFDTGNPIVLGEDVLGLLEKVVHRVVVVHIFDVREVGGFEPVRVGLGVSPIAEVFSRLKRAGYEGWFSIEEASSSGTRGFQESIAYVRDIWSRVRV